MSDFVSFPMARYLDTKNPECEILARVSPETAHILRSSTDRQVLIPEPDYRVLMRVTKQRENYKAPPPPPPARKKTEAQKLAFERSRCLEPGTPRCIILALLLRRNLTAAEIAEEGLGRQQIYRALSSLQKLGLVRRSGGQYPVYWLTPEGKVAGRMAEDAEAGV